MATQTAVLVSQGVTASGTGVALTDGTVSRQWMTPAGFVINEQVIGGAVAVARPVVQSCG